MIFHSNYKWRKHITLYQKYVLIKKESYSWCITLKISWYIEGIEDCSHIKKYPSSSYGFGAGYDFPFNCKLRIHITLYQKYVLIKKDTSSWCITMKISWYFEGMEDSSHIKNYPSSSSGFGVNIKKHIEIFVWLFLKSLDFSYIKNRHAKITK